jgi:ATP-dependent protease ClpP protease subunit
MRFSLPNARIMVHQPSGGSRARPPTSSGTPRTS